MSVALRLQRIGKPKQPYYRIVAIDKRQPGTGRPLEVLGSYNPRGEKPKDKVHMKLDRVEYWMKVGAQASGTVLSLVKSAKKAAKETPKAEAA